MNNDKTLYKPFVDAKTGNLGYSTWHKPGKTDPEVDSAYLTCYYFYFSSLLKKERDYLNRDLQAGYDRSLKTFLTNKPGVFARFDRIGMNQVENNTKPPGFFNDPRNLSRDNTTPILITLGHFGHSEHIVSFMKQMLKRYSFFQNTHTYLGEKKSMPDLATPDNWACFIRAFYEANENRITQLGKLLTYFVLCFCDVFSVFQTFLHVAHTKFINPNESGSELNYFAMALQRKYVLPTPLGLIANRIYTFRARPTEGTNLHENNIQASVEEFFSKGYRAKIMPPLDYLTKELYDRI